MSNTRSLFDSPKFKQLLDSYLSSGSEQPPPIVDLYMKPFRVKEREHIEVILGQLNNHSYARRIESRLLLTPEYLGAWHELMVFDWLSGLGKQLALQPSIEGSKPEFFYESNGLPIFIEVAAVQESLNDNDVGKTIGGVKIWAPEATETFKKLNGVLTHKAGQHSSIKKAAYVICLCLESRLIDIGEVKTYFLGGEAVDMAGELHPRLDGLVFESQDNLQLPKKYKNVSALLVAKHSRNSAEEGYKLVFGLIQNPYATNPISPNEFGALTRYVIVSETQEHIQMKWLH